MLAHKAVRISSALIVLVCAGAGAFVASCDRYFKPSGPIQAAALIPGAEYVGMEVCETCHKKQAAEFRGSAHAAFTVEQKDPDKVQTGEGCESCHGPGSLHIAGRGDKTKIIRYDWRTCTACHLDKRASFSKMFHHPVPEGRMSCASCHDPHVGMNGSTLARPRGVTPVSHVEAINETCFNCHPDKRGPWTFEHDAVRQDGCTICHDPHGTNVKMMLVSDVGNLCLRCHFDSHKSSTLGYPYIGTVNHVDYVHRGCTNCHRAIHGSNSQRQLEYP